MQVLVGNNSPPLGANATGRWVKYTLTYSDFSDTGATKQVNLHTLAAGGVVHACKIKHSTAFSGGASTAYTVSVGTAASPTDIAAAFDVFQATGDTTFQLSSTPKSYNHGATTQLIAEATVTNDVLSNVTAGSVDIWLFVSEAV